MKKQLRRLRGKYLIAILLPVLVWTAVFSLLDRPSANERLRILYAGEGLDTAALQAELEAALPPLTKQSLKEITVTQETPSGVSPGEWLTSRQFSYDLLILSEPWCPENAGQKFFGRIKEPLLSRFSSAAKYTETVDGTELTYALVLRGGETETKFCEFTDTDSVCLLFFSPESVSLGGGNGKGNPEDDAAAAAAEYLSEASR